MTDLTAAPPSGTVGTVLRTEQLSPHLVRVVLGGPGLDGFADPQDADSYVNAQFLPPGAGYEAPFDPEAVRDLPEKQRPRPRRYTVRAWDPVRRELSIDFVVHGDGGVAGPWAQRARPGDRLQLRGPAGGHTPDPTADAFLLVGDGSALPAIAVVLEQLPAGAPALAVLEVPGPADEIALSSPGALDLHWVHGDGDRADLLATRLAALPRPQGRVEAFVHGEAESVRAVRRVLLGTWGLDPADLSLSAYWSFGRTDEQWRQVKGAWTRSLEHDLSG